MNRTRLLLTSALLCGGGVSCAGRPHVYAGVQRVTTLKEATQHHGTADFSAYLNFIQPLKHGLSLQIQPIFPLSGDERLLRIGFDWELPLFRK